MILLPGAQQNQITDRDLQSALLANIDTPAIAAAEISFLPVLITHSDALSSLNACDLECLALRTRKLHLLYSYLGRHNFTSYVFKAARIMGDPGIKKQIQPHWKKLQIFIDQ